MPNERSRRKSKDLTEAVAKTATFVTVWAVLTIIGLLWFLRPTFSIVEKRELAKFPEFSVEGVLDGTYFSKIDTWFSDTFPIRESLISFNDKFRECYGIRNSLIHGDIGQGEEIPTGTVDLSDLLGTDTDDPGYKPPEVPDFTGGGITEPEDTPPIDESSSEESSSEDSSKPLDTTKPPITTEPPPVTTKPEGGGTAPPETNNSILIYGNAAYEFYYFSQSVSAKYCLAVNRLAEALKGKAELYNIIIPSAGSVVLGMDEWLKYGSSNPVDAIEWMQSQMDPSVHKINPYDTLYAHRDEYLFFRTDHHWTALGAYYTYTDFCKAKGITPNDLSSFKTITIDGFRGTLYSATKSPKLKTDTVIGYYPMGTNSMYFISKNNGKYSKTWWNIITDVSGWHESLRYNCFAGADQPFSYAHNPKVNDGSSVLLVKNSFGNAFVPFLVDHYEHIYWVDFRYFESYATSESLYNACISGLVESKGIDDVIILTNVSATSTSSLVTPLDRICK
ncbi:MAG: DHHW family protein [Eubacteriales bacterium]